MMRPAWFAGGRGRDGLCEHKGRDGCLLFLCLLGEPFEHEGRDGLCEHNGRDGRLLFPCLLTKPFEHEG